MMLNPEIKAAEETCRIGIRRLEIECELEQIFQVFPEFLSRTDDERREIVEDCAIGMMKLK